MTGVSLFADEFDQLAIQHNSLIDFNGPGLCVCFGIVDCNLDFEVPIIGASEAFDDFCLIRHRAAAHVEPLQVGEPGAFDHESIAFPTAYRVAVIPGLDVIFIRQFPSIREYLSQAVIRLINHY